jgi:hypothetical protein
VRAAARATLIRRGRERSRVQERPINPSASSKGIAMKAASFQPRDELAISFVSHAVAQNVIDTAKNCRRAYLVERSGPCEAEGVILVANFVHGDPSGRI